MSTDREVTSKSDANFVFFKVESTFSGRESRSKTKTSEPGFIGPSQSAQAVPANSQSLIISDPPHALYNRVKDVWSLQLNLQDFSRLAEWEQSAVDELARLESRFIDLESFLQNNGLVYFRKIEKYLSHHGGLPSDINW